MACIFVQISILTSVVVLHWLAAVPLRKLVEIVAFGAKISLNLIDGEVELVIVVGCKVEKQQDSTLQFKLRRGHRRRG